MKKLILLLGSICVILLVTFFICQDKLVPKKIEINLEDSYIIYKIEDYKDFQKTDSITEYKFTKDSCTVKWYLGNTPNNINDYKEYKLDQTTYIEVMSVLINEMKFFTMEQPSIGGGIQTRLEIKNGDLFRNIYTQESDMWEQIKKLMNATDPPM